MMSRRIKFDPISILLILGTFLTNPLKTVYYGASGEEHAPFIFAVVYLLLTLFPLFDRRGGLITRLDAYTRIVRSVVIVLSFRHYVAVATGLWLDLPLIMLAPNITLGLIFILIGNHLPQLRPNTFAGLRSPWALRDLDNWRKTHRVGGYAAILTGISLILYPLWLPIRYYFPGLFAHLFLFTAGLFLYSYWLHRRNNLKVL